MKKLSPSLLLAAAIALCANSALAQGTMLATWHNQNGPIQGNLFQASFQIYDSEIAPGADFSVTRLFDQTLTVASPDHVFPALGPGAHIEVGPTGGGSGFTGPNGSLYLCAGFADPANPSFLVGVQDSQIFETVNGVPTYREQGYWTFTSVPEPSSIVLLVIGLLPLLSKNGIASGNGLVLTPATVTTLHL
jgi:hypothetical protein